jgi:hypothetical protein
VHSSLEGYREKLSDVAQKMDGPSHSKLVPDQGRQAAPESPEGRLAVSMSQDRFYSGKFSGEVAILDGGGTRLLEPCPELCADERISFTWGRERAGAAHLAYALLKDARSEAVARLFYHSFSTRVVENFPAKWIISRSRIIAHLAMIKYQTDRGLS